jgi:hypothetical protein
MIYAPVDSERMYVLALLHPNGFADPLESEERDLEMMLKVIAAV